jgi:hypothetical protein
MSLDIPDTHTPGVHGDNFLIQGAQHRLMLLDHRRLKFGIAVPGHLDTYGAVIAFQSFGAGAIAAVAGPLSRRRVLLITQMFSQFGVQHPLDSLLDELLYGPIFTQQVIYGLAGF